jgi:hypothetical protein
MTKFHDVTVNICTKNLQTRAYEIMMGVGHIRTSGIEDSAFVREAVHIIRLVTPLNAAKASEREYVQHRLFSN